jgi:hypothetical protein
MLIKKTFLQFYVSLLCNVLYNFQNIFFLPNSTAIEQVNYNTFTSSMTSPVSEKIICILGYGKFLNEWQYIRSNHLTRKGK